MCAHTHTRLPARTYTHSPLKCWLCSIRNLGSLSALFKRVTHTHTLIPPPPIRIKTLLYLTHTYMPTNTHVHAHTRTYMPACPDIHPPTIKVLALLHEEPGTLVPLLLQQLLHGHWQAEKREQITLFQTGYCFPGKYTAVSIRTRMNSNTEPRCAEHVGHTITWQTQATSAMQWMKLISVLNADRYSGQQVTLISSVLVMPFAHMFHGKWTEGRATLVQ